jgi:predicted nuclease of restriction endonuclease-like (RecB) superfamily
MSKKEFFPPQPSANPLITEIKDLVAESRQQVAVAVNSAMSMLYWQIGRRINEEVLQNQRAEYGKEIVHTLSPQLSDEYGAAFSEKNLRRMMQFAKVFPEQEIVVSLIRQLSWTHIIAIIPIEEPLKRDFYIEMCKLEKWSVRTFRERINSMLYERTAISKKPELTIQNELELLKNSKQISPDLVFRDPYFLDFLGLKDTYSEKDLEESILVELQKFIIELGSDFAFMARQKRISIDNEDYYLDLLFYHRRLKCLVAIELKLGKFEAAHKGQMELYLHWLEKYESIEGENPPIGLILCASKNQEHVELLQLENSNIKIAEYLTQLPDLKLIEQKLHQAIAIAKNRINEGENSTNPKIQ